MFRMWEHRLASYSKAGKTLLVLPSLNRINDLSLLIKILHPFLGKGCPGHRASALTSVIDSAAPNIGMRFTLSAAKPIFLNSTLRKLKLS